MTVCINGNEARMTVCVAKLPYYKRGTYDGGNEARMTVCVGEGCTTWLSFHTINGRLRHLAKLPYYSLMKTAEFVNSMEA